MIAALDGSDWLVIVAGVAAIVWVNWYFFAAEHSVALSADAETRPDPANRR